MFKPIMIVAILAALAIQPAAAKLGGGHTVSDSSVQKQEQRGLVAVVIDQIRISASAIVGHSAKAASESRSQYSYFYSRKECEAAKEAEVEEAETAEAKAEEPVGPEPLYFGF